MEIRWLVIIVIGIVIVVSASRVLSLEGDSDAVKLEAIKTGLEQCRMTNYSTSKVIWVRDCEAYTKTIKD